MRWCGGCCFEDGADSDRPHRLGDFLVGKLRMLSIDLIIDGDYRQPLDMDGRAQWHSRRP